MAKKYLDENGVRYLWTKLKNWVNSVVPSKSDVMANTNARHSHTNKSVIDNITADNVASWNNSTENYIVNITEHENNGEYTYTSDNWQGIEAAYRANKRIFCIFDDKVIPLAVFAETEDGYSEATFVTSMALDYSNIEYTAITINLSNGNTELILANITVPTNTSELTNDSNYLTSANIKSVVVSDSVPTTDDRTVLTLVLKG